MPVGVNNALYRPAVEAMLGQCSVICNIFELNSCTSMGIQYGRNSSKNVTIGCMKKSVKLSVSDALLTFTHDQQQQLTAHESIRSHVNQSKQNALHPFCSR